MHLIERTLLSKPGVEKAVVTLTTNRGHVEFDPALLGPRDITKIVKVVHVMCVQKKSCFFKGFFFYI